MGDVGAMNEESTTTTRSSRGPAVNAVQLLGRLTAAPELKYTPNGKAVAEIRMATNERPEPEYHDVVAYEKLGEAVAEYTRKGALVFVEGRLHSQSWKTQDGSARRRVVVVAASIQFLERAARDQ